MRRAISAAAIAAGIVISTVGVAAPAQADTEGCVSKTEYKRVHNGNAKKFVHRVFDTAGKQTYTSSYGGTRYESREYKPCSSRKWGFVTVDYTNGKVDYKSAYWG